MAANNTETITQKRTRPKKIILDISASFSLSGISTSKLEKSEGLKFGFNTTWAIRRVNKRKTSPSTKSKIGTSAIVAAIASAPTTTEEPKNIAIPATSTAIVAIPASTDRESDVKLDEVIGLLDSNMPGTPSARNRSSLIANANANANTMIASPILAHVQRVQSIRSASTQESSSPPPSQSPKSKPSQSQPKPARTAPKPTKSELPLKALNQSITSRLTTPSGARSTGRGKPLPGNYQSVARRVTMTIVALPILFVTSWVLWDRLVLGQEKKSLLRDPPMVPGPPMAAEMEARNNRE
ncbi:hypothetical protein BGAL_0767g00020 [Botrytis galanthina]|uniref:Uncharacterized protein n=1 Tax=Botrytis galanthina TaxID=278940 RepID=A0A4S8QJL5_9HELO|nr:hypothetical protein BGAL_0767g00020 [Botrytis galanthina]